MASFLSTPQSISSIPFLPTASKGTTSSGNTLAGLTGDETGAGLEQSGVLRR